MGYREQSWAPSVLTYLRKASRSFGALLTGSAYSFAYKYRCGRLSGLTTYSHDASCRHVGCIFGVSEASQSSNEAGSANAWSRLYILFFREPSNLILILLPIKRSKYQGQTKLKQRGRNFDRKRIYPRRQVGVVVAVYLLHNI